MEKICTAARNAKIAVVLGFSENDHNSLYISQCTISATGDIVMKRRKFKPTHMERTVFGDAGGTSLNNVVDVEGVGKVGAYAAFAEVPYNKSEGADTCGCMAADSSFSRRKRGTLQHERRR